MLRNGQTPTESTFVSLLWAYRNSKAATSKDDALEIVRLRFLVLHKCAFRSCALSRGNADSAFD
jgi:hypothetical protein